MITKEQSGMIARFTVSYLIKHGLGYCCLWFFFRRFKQTALIAARLGVTERVIRLHRAKWKAGEYKCEGCSNCMKARIIAESARRAAARRSLKEH
jgi:hypothetical protein